MGSSSSMTTLRKSRAPTRALSSTGTMTTPADRPSRQVAPFQWIKGRWRCEGYHYPSLPHLDLRDHDPLRFIRGEYAAFIEH
jgi:hypothetical protein